MNIYDETGGYYDVLAEYYPYFFRDWETQLEREGLSLRAIFRHRGIIRVLDAFCGPGLRAVSLANLGFEVVAADPSAGMLRQAHEIAQAHNVVDKIEFVRTDFFELPKFVEGPFDAVICKGNALPHLLLDGEIAETILIFNALLRPGGTLVVGMQDFGPFEENRPRFIPGFVTTDETGVEVITFEIWEWEDGPPTIATQSLFIVTGKGKRYSATKRQVMFRPISTAEIKVVLADLGFEDITDQPDRAERVLVARKPLGAK